MDKRPPQTKVKVVVRVRPPLTPNENLCVSAIGNRVQIVNHRNVGENLQYEFHTVLDEKASQADVFASSVQPLLDQVLHGQNVSVFAYGPTGAGKTHTMLGGTSDPGIIPRVIQSVFKAIKAQKSSSRDSGEHKVSFSYLEIYNEKVQDLLTPSQQDLPIREDASHNIFVAGLSEKTIDGFDTFKSHFEPAASNRTVGATRLNKHSSRSHTILMLKVCHKEQNGKLLRGKLYLIDLAGSEDNRRTGNQGIRLKESGAINKSLFVLGEVVDAINNNLPRVPYRNSKLTRLLQDSIGGSCHSVMITNIAPEQQFYYDTYCTLNFATKSKKIVNTVVVNVDEPQIEKPTAAVKPIRRLSGSQGLARGGSTSSKSQSVRRRSASLCEPLPSPLLRQQKAFQSEIEEKVAAMEKLLLQSFNNRQATSSCYTHDESQQPERRKSRRSLRYSHAPVTSGENSPYVINPTPQKLKDATNLLKMRHFGPKQQVKKDNKAHISSVVDDNTSCSPFFPQNLGKRRSSEDFESPVTKKLKSQPLKFTNSDQAKRNEEFLHVLNTAGVKELQQLQTVGVKRAKMIYEWREIHGAFSSVNDMLQVPGFSGKFLDKLLLRNLVTGT